MYRNTKMSNLSPEEEEQIKNWCYPGISEPIRPSFLNHIPNSNRIKFCRERFLPEEDHPPPNGGGKKRSKKSRKSGKKSKRRSRKARRSRRRRSRK